MPVEGADSLSNTQAFKLTVQGKVSEKIGQLPTKGEVKQKLETNFSREKFDKASNSAKTSAGKSLASFASYHKKQMTNSAKIAFHKAISGLARGLEKIAHYTLSAVEDKLKSAKKEHTKAANAISHDKNIDRITKLMDSRPKKVENIVSKPENKPPTEVGKTTNLPQTEVDEKKKSTPPVKNKVAPSSSNSINSNLNCISKTDNGIAVSLRDTYEEVSRSESPDKQSNLDAITSIIKNVSTICNTIETRKNKDEDAESLLLDLVECFPDKDGLNNLKQIEKKLDDVESNNNDINFEIKKPSTAAPEIPAEEVKVEEPLTKATETLTEEIEEDISTEKVDFEESFEDNPMAFGEEIAQKLGERSNRIALMSRGIDSLPKDNQDLANILEETLTKAVSSLKASDTHDSIKDKLDATSSIIKKTRVISENINKELVRADKADSQEDYDKWDNRQTDLLDLLSSFDDSHDSYSLNNLKEVNKTLDEKMNEFGIKLPDLAKTARTNRPRAPQNRP